MSRQDEDRKVLTVAAKRAKAAGAINMPVATARVIELFGDDVIPVSQMQAYSAYVARGEGYKHTATLEVDQVLSALGVG